MNKAELVTAMAEKSGLTKAAAEKALNSFTEAIKESMTKGERVGLVGFGSFSVAERSARTGRNPQTGKEITIPAKKVVKFKPGADLAL
jgi:DNA-binding protein HU-beta